MSKDKQWKPLPAPFNRRARVRYVGAGDPEHPWLESGMVGEVKRTWRGSEGDPLTERPPFHGRSEIWFNPDGRWVALVGHDQVASFELIVDRRQRQKEDAGMEHHSDVLEKMDLPEWVWEDGGKAACWYLLMAPVMRAHMEALGRNGVQWLSRSDDDLQIDWDSLTSMGSGGVEALAAFARAWWDQVPVDLEQWLRLDEANRNRVLNSFEIRQRGGSHALRLLRTHEILS